MAVLEIVSFAAVFWMSRNVPPKETSLGGALRDIQKTAAKETILETDWCEHSLHGWLAG